MNGSRTNGAGTTSNCEISDDDEILILDDPSAPSVSSNQKNALHGDASEKDIEIVEEVENTAGRTETIPEQALVKFSGLEGGEVIPVIDLEEPELEVIENQESATPIGNAGVERTSNDDEDDFCVVENTGKTNSIDNKEFVAENAMKFLKWFYRVPTADYYNHLVYSRPNYLTKSIVPDEYALDVEAAKRLLHEYLTVFNSRIKILIDFYDEYAEEVIRVMLILAAVLENGNKRIDWTILCREYLNNRMLKKARKFFEKPTVFSDPPAKNGPKELLEHLLVLTPEAILATTVVFFEAKGWCEKVVLYSSTEMTAFSEEEISATQAAIMKAAADHFKKQRDSGVIPVHSLCAQNIKELEELKATLEAKCENSRRITLLSPERMANARLSLVHQEVLHEVIMDGREMREQIQDEIVLLAEKTREINEIEKVFKKVFEENSMIDLRSYLCPIPGEYCLARRAALDTAGMELARLVEQINVLCWKVKFCVDGFQAHVQLHDIAIVRCGITDPHVASSQYIGLRVACLIKEPGKIDRWDTGTVGCRPNLIHNGRFLVFMDDGRDIYMNVPSHDSGDMTAAKSIPYGTDDDKMMMRRLCLMKALPMALQSYPEKSDTWSIDRPGVVNVLRDHARVPFLRKFLRKYPDWPLIPMKKRGNGDHVKQLKIVDPKRNQRRMVAVVDVDCALCTVRYIPDANVDGRDCFQFPCHQHIHRDEVVYRGSTRFENIMIGQNEHSNVSRRARDKFRNHFDTAEPFLSEPVFSQPRYVDPAQSGRMRQVQEPTQAQFSRGQIEGRYRKQALIIKTRVPATPAPPSLKPHKKCKKDCLRDLDCDPYDSRFHQCSPLHIPSVCGWTRTKICQRIVSSKRPKEKIVVMYRAPCGRTCRNFDEIALFLRETGSRITIDCFTFDDEIETDVYVTVQKKFVCNDDYAHGIERMPIPAVNSVDDEPPPELIYTNQRFPYDQTVDVNSINRGFCSGCSCEGDCSDATKCECQMLSAAEYERLPKGLKIPEMKGDKVYPYENRIIAGKYMGGIFECNDQCACNRSSCFNRVIQHPIKYPIQLFKTAESGWGVRTLADIPEGAFICTYAGALLTDEIADRLKNEDQYFADLDLRDTVEREKMFEDNETDEGLGGDFESDEDYENNSETSGDTFVATRNNGKRSKRPRTDDYREESVVPRETRRRNDEENFFKWDEYFGDNALFVVDAKNRGNIGRFLNHSCEPNVYVQHVMYDTHDLRLPHLAFFSNENIKAGAELCWNYSYEIDETKERIMCKCGAKTCRKRLL